MSLVEEATKFEVNLKSGQRNVVITGFGLFRDHKINPSWEAIKDGQLKIDRDDIKVIAKQVDVSYAEVDEVVETLWKEYNPIVMIHVGLAAHEVSIRLEQVARHGPYINDDVRKQAPHKELREKVDGGSTEDSNTRPTYTCKPCEFGCSSSCIDLDKVCDKMNQAYKEGILAIPTKTSRDAGLYVCEYIYHKSLCVCDRAVFIHVPDVDSFKLDDIREALNFAVEAIIEAVQSA